METKEQLLTYKKSYPNTTYVEMANRFGVSASTVREHLNPEVGKLKGEQKKERIFEKKSILVKEFGGKCTQCGYDKYISLLHFHHLDPTKKEFTIAHDKPLDKMREEAKKCILLCSRCHGEAHIGNTTEGRKLRESR